VQNIVAVSQAPNDYNFPAAHAVKVEGREQRRYGYAVEPEGVDCGLKRREPTATPWA
jgi:hypothetical protein